ncbi:MAG TPA: DUF378 domain-containing protein [Parcubacteria group bacterium]|nr:DUF378 domain-containing protein [Parcubacteria group bacterium]
MFAIINLEVISKLINLMLHKIAFILLIVGGLNWLLTGLMSSWDLANFVGSTVAMVIYILVGISAIVEIFGHKKMCRNCNASGSTM